MAGLGLKGRKVTVLGANLSGFALVRFLVKKGSLVTLVDPHPAEKIQSTVAEALDLSKFHFEAGEYNPKTFEESQLILVTPSFPIDLKILEQARTLGVPVQSELEFVAEYVEEPLIAVAGTSGKSTTAALLGKILEESGKNVFVNVQQPLAEYLNRAKPADYVIATASAFQLEGVVNFKPAMILFLNVSEDFAHRYPNYESYIAANREVLKNVDEKTILIGNSADPHVMQAFQALSAQKLYFGSTVQADPQIPGAWGDKNQVHVSPGSGGSTLSLSLKNFRLRGPHNRQNLMAAALAALQLDAKPEAIQKIVDSFYALPNRVEFVRRINSVAFYNDSAGGNVNAVLNTLQSFHEPVILISGGRDKNADYTPLIPHIRQRVKNLILLGEAKEKFNRAVGDFTETFLVGTIEEAILLAYQKSRSGDVILFSPGCDPTDMFATNEERGEVFRGLVNQISQPRRPNVI